jgi:hypothetical protein
MHAGDTTGGIAMVKCGDEKHWNIATWTHCPDSIFPEIIMIDSSLLFLASIATWIATN